MTEKEVLEGMLELLSDSDSWTQGTHARTNDGRAVSLLSPHATSYCLLGALYKVYCSDFSGTVVSSDFSGAVVSHLQSGVPEFNFSLSLFNDSPSTTHEDVVLFIKNALYRLENE